MVIVYSIPFKFNNIFQQSTSISLHDLFAEINLHASAVLVKLVPLTFYITNLQPSEIFIIMLRPGQLVIRVLLPIVLSY